jgi:succinate dehydrogenase / fumarate reductase flavoprotein subunit
MYHQFKQLADIDITKEAMEVGPTTHYVMGGVRVDADTQMSAVPGLFAAGECAAGINGANRLGGNSLSDIVVFGKRAGQYAAEHARAQRALVINTSRVDALEKAVLAPFDRGDRAESPYAVQRDLQNMMQERVGIVRTEAEMLEALRGLEALDGRAARVGVAGHREYHTGWHTALDLRNLLLVSEAITRSALERRESRGGHFREDYPATAPDWGQVNVQVARGGDGAMQVRRIPIPPMPEELKRVIEEMK